MNFIKRFWISICACLAIFYLCFMNTSELPQVEVNQFDKLIHCVMTAGLSLIIFFELTFYFRKHLSIRNLFLGCWLFPVVFMGLIELMQEYISIHRTGDWNDFIANTFGACIGFIFCWGGNFKLRTKR